VRDRPSRSRTAGADVLGIDATPHAVNAGWIGAVGTGLIRFADISGLARNDHVFQPERGTTRLRRDLRRLPGPAQT